MPELHTMGAFIAAAILLLVMPGPTDSLVVSYVLTRGRRSALVSVPAGLRLSFASMVWTLAGPGVPKCVSAMNKSGSIAGPGAEGGKHSN